MCGICDELGYNACDKCGMLVLDVKRATLCINHRSTGRQGRQ